MKQHRHRYRRNTELGASVFEYALVVALVVLVVVVAQRAFSAAIHSRNESSMEIVSEKGTSTAEQSIAPCRNGGTLDASAGECI